MTHEEIADYIQASFITCSPKWRPLTRREAESYATDVLNNGYNNRTEIKDYLFYSKGLAWK